MEALAAAAGLALAAAAGGLYATLEVRRRRLQRQMTALLDEWRERRRRAALALLSHRSG